MKKINIIKKSTEFDRIIHKKNSFFSDNFIINIEQNEEYLPRFGITFIKNIGNAVTRNGLKRKIKSIIDNNKNIYQNDKNYIIIIKKGAIAKKYIDLEQELVALFKKTKEKKNEKEN